MELRRNTTLAHGLQSVPKILDVPEKLLPMIERLDDYRYILLEGGRGGGKSHAIGRFLLFLGDRYKLRIVCGREIQKNISESVYNLLVDLIREYQLDYEIFATKLLHRKSGSEINFRGFRDSGKSTFNIQGMEGVDILWLDESQAVSKQTMDVLIPTIRKDNAKVFFSMNRHLHDDPAYLFCEGRADCLHIKLNYYDNKFCTQALKNEAEECRKRSLSDFLHIWEGEPLAQGEDMVYGHEELVSAMEQECLIKAGYGIRIAGFDVARFGGDSSSVCILQQNGALFWECVHAESWDKSDLNYTAGRILDISHTWKTDFNVIDEDGLGSAPLDILTKGRNLQEFEGYRNLVINFRENRDYANCRTRDAYKLKDMIRKGHIKIPYKQVIDELEHAFRFKYDHYQRKILVSKEEMLKKYNVKSPNLADALIYAVSKVGTFDYKATLANNRHPQYSKEDSLFATAGVR